MIELIPSLKLKPAKSGSNSWQVYRNFLLFILLETITDEEERKKIKMVLQNANQIGGTQVQLGNLTNYAQNQMSFSQMQQAIGG